MLNTHYISNILEMGIDEAGRGPMFGRVYAGAAILPPDFNHSLMKDSKKLSERKRLIAYDYIKEYAIDYSTAYCTEGEIDIINIFKATQTAMHRAIAKCQVIPDHLLIDGPHFDTYFNNERFIPHTCIIDGDNTYTSIAAASILAKVERDKYIEKMCDDFSNLDDRYALRKNKGYGTKQHMEGLKRYGITKWHRKSFGICKQLSGI
jgi:ribonuclease HII